MIKLWPITNKFNRNANIYNNVYLGIMIRSYVLHNRARAYVRNRWMYVHIASACRHSAYSLYSSLLYAKRRKEEREREGGERGGRRENWERERERSREGDDTSVWNIVICGVIRFCPARVHWHNCKTSANSESFINISLCSFLLIVHRKENARKLYLKYRKMSTEGNTISTWCTCISLISIVSAQKQDVIMEYRNRACSVSRVFYTYLKDVISLDD